MGKYARIGLLVGAGACLLAVMVDWVVEELHEEAIESTDDYAAQPDTQAPAPAAEPAPESAPSAASPPSP